MKPAPKNWPRLSSSLFYRDAGAAIDWLCKAFGFEVRLRIESDDQVIEHSELIYGEALVMVGDERRQKALGRPLVSPRSTGGLSTQALMLFVDDAEAHCAHARAAGATIVTEPKVSDYGEDYWVDKTYAAQDLEGHFWWFCERVRG